MSNTVFFPPKNKRLARIISIKSTKSFRKSIRTLKRNGLSLKEKRALVLARTRARIISQNKRVSFRVRKEKARIGRMKI